MLRRFIVPAVLVLVILAMLAPEHRAYRFVSVTPGVELVLEAHQPY
jgi:hypothetical protein